MTEFVLEPLYTQKEIRDFRKKNEQNGKFTVTKDNCKINRRFGEVIYGMAACNRICGQ